MITPRNFFLATVFGFTAILHGDESVEKLVRATYKIFHKDSTATGLVVSHQDAQFVITAHHVLERIPSPNCVLVSRLKDGEQFRRKDRSLNIRDENGRRLWKKHPKHDLAVLRLPDDWDLEALPSRVLANEDDVSRIHTGDHLFAAVFPEREEANGAGFPIVRSGNIASFPISPIGPHHQFLIDMTTFSGDSGGPVIHQELRRGEGNLPIVIGFVLGLRRTTETVKESRYVERKIHHPLGVGYAIHADFALKMLDE